MMDVESDNGSSIVFATDVIAELASGAARYAAHARADATLAAYGSDWRIFSDWCDSVGRTALPAEPSTVAMYLTAEAQTKKPATLARRLATISVAHEAAGVPSPTTDRRVRDVLAGIRREKGSTQRQVRPFRLSEVVRSVSALPQTTSGARDAALILVGFATGARRSELAAIEVDHLAERDGGVILTVPRSKTDPSGAGQAKWVPEGSDRSTCPITALNRWMSAANIETGPVFRRVDRHGNIGTEALSPTAVAQVIKRAAEAAGLDPTDFSGHSLRSGHVTAADAAGVRWGDIARQTGHRDFRSIERYVRHENIALANSANALGL